LGWGHQGRSPHPGRTLLDAALAGGAQVSARKIGAISPGHRADLVELDDTNPILYGRAQDSLLDAWIFSGQHSPIRTVVCGGKPVVEAGRHIHAMTIRDAFRAAMRRLLA
jgi:formimidoylglutamate deiminase